MWINDDQGSSLPPKLSLQGTYDFQYQIQAINEKQYYHQLVEVVMI